MFDFPEEIRRATYTTHAIESLNSAIRKFTKNRKHYPREQYASKLVYMAIREASNRRTRPIKYWKQALNHFAILFPDRMPKDYQAKSEVHLTQNSGQAPTEQALSGILFSPIQKSPTICGLAGHSAIRRRLFFMGAINSLELDT